MALLSEASLFQAWAQVMRKEEIGTLALTKADLRAAVDAVDSWLDTNAAAFNSALPQPARGALTTKQKAALLVHVAAERYKL